MIKKIKQITTEVVGTTYGDNVLPNIGKILMLGIQAPEGTLFSFDKENDIRMNSTGIFELNLNGFGSIQELYFKQDSEELDFAQVYIDIVYEQAEEVPSL